MSASKLRARCASIPIGAWLSAIVLVSIAVRIAVSSRMVAPWIMIDEVVYSELAKSFAAHGSFLVRDVPSHGYGFVYPILIAPAWRLFASIPDAYLAARVINSIVMSLAAVPAYFLARRLLSSRLSLLAAALSVLVPGMLYTGSLMTENAFYPVVLSLALLLVVTLEHPTPLRQAGLLALCLLAFETRAQAVAFIPAVVVAPLLLAWIERRGLRATIRRFAVLYGILAAGVVGALLLTVARGRSPVTLLGAYQAAASSSTYSVDGALRFLLYHLGGLDLSVGVVPFAALLALWISPRQLSPGARAFAAASLALSVFLVAEVALFASASYVNRIEERNMFYLAPLALIALLGLAGESAAPRGRRTLLVAAGAAGVLPFFVPYTRFIDTSALSDTFSLLPWWWLQDNVITLEQVRYAALGVSLAAAAAFVLVPRRWVLVLPAGVALYFVLTSYLVEAGRHGIHRTTVGDAWAASHLPYRNWIDRTVGQDASVAVLWTGSPATYPLWESEFFNRSVGTVYAYEGAPRPDPLAATDLTRIDRGPRTGELVIPSASPGDPGVAPHVQYVLSDGSVELKGRVIVADPVGVKLYRIDGPIVVLTHVTGLYPHDSWSGPTVTYERVACTGGRLSVRLGSDSSLFRAPQQVLAREGGRVVARASVPVTGEATLVVPLAPAADGRCTVLFEIPTTAVPAAVNPKARPVDHRRLGVHFLAFEFRP